MGEERHAPAFEWPAEFRVSEEAVDTEKGHWRCLRQAGDEATGVMEIRLFSIWMDQCPIRPGPVLLLQHRGEAEFPVRVCRNRD
jgi:hypothetical protein